VIQLFTKAKIKSYRHLSLSISSQTHPNNSELGNPAKFY